MEALYLILTLIYFIISIGLWHLFSIEWLRDGDNVIDYFRFIYKESTAVGKVVFTLSFIPTAVLYYIMKYLKNIFIRGN